MPPLSPLPSVVLVHGAWHTPSAYQTYIDALRNAGFRVHCPLLPSCSGTLTSLPTPPVSLREDAAAVRALVTSLVENGESVLMIMHSYGGAVGTDAVGHSESETPLDFAARRAAGLEGGVVNLLYLCAYILDAGRSVWDIVEEAGFAPLWDQFIETNAADRSIFPRDPGLAFFSRPNEGGRNEDEDIKHLKPLLVRFPMSALQTPVQYAAWKHIPSSYVYTQNDFSVPRTYQDLMTKHVRDQGVDLRTEDYNTHHSIWVSHLDDMVQAALKAAEIRDRTPRRRR
ncbi:alpha/beta-hydrolase [Xylariaceae sp. AK1471]|nr:alpha/beta-hydrolase [Xylariaceae sp. AK1471]